MSSPDNKTEHVKGVEAEQGEQEKSQSEIEKEQEAKLRAKFPALKGHGSSTFLQ